MSAERAARETIDTLLAQAGWRVCDVKDADLHAARGVAIREFPLPGYGFADYLLTITGNVANVIVVGSSKKPRRPSHATLRTPLWRRA